MILRTRQPSLGTIALTIGCGFATLLAVVVTSKQPSLQMEATILLAAVIPAYLLAVVDRVAVLGYVWACWIIGPEIRRINDWNVGAYQSITLLSLIPMLATGALVLRLVFQSNGLPSRARFATQAFSLVLAYGFLVGMVRNGGQAIFDLANHLAPFLMFIYIVFQQLSAEDLDRLVRQVVLLGVVVASYGWYQYLAQPPWDMLWLREGWIAVPAPGQPIMIFSTMNSRGPAGIFLATSLILGFVDRRWRGIAGWPGLLLIMSALAINQSRTSWLTAAVGILIGIAVLRGQQKARATMVLVAILIAGTFLLPKLPGMSNVSDRMATLTKLSRDRSFNERSAFASQASVNMVQEPFGKGLGAVGKAIKLAKGGKVAKALNSKVAAGEMDFDNGFLAIFTIFGLVAGCGIFYTLFIIGSQAFKKARGGGSAARFSVATFSYLVASIVLLTSGYTLTGVTGAMLWFIIALVVKDIANDHDEDTSNQNETSFRNDHHEERRVIHRPVHQQRSLGGRGVGSRLR